MSATPSPASTLLQRTERAIVDRKCMVRAKLHRGDPIEADLIRIAALKAEARALRAGRPKRTSPAAQSDWPRIFAP